MDNATITPDELNPVLQKLFPIVSVREHAREDLSQRLPCPEDEGWTRRS